MNGAAHVNRKRGNSVSYETTAAQLLAEMTRIEEHMDAHRAESIRLAAEIHSIKDETEAIKTRTATTLSQLLQGMNRLAETR